MEHGREDIFFWEERGGVLGGSKSEADLLAGVVVEAEEVGAVGEGEFGEGVDVEVVECHEGLDEGGDAAEEEEGV